MGNRLDSELCFGQPATGQSLLTAISELVNVGPDELEDYVGRIGFSGDQQGAAVAPWAQFWFNEETDTTVFLVNRIPAGREAAVFLSQIVHRHGQSHLNVDYLDDLVERIQVWRHRSPSSVEGVVYGSAVGRLQPTGSDRELLAYAVEEAVAIGVVPSVDAAEGSIAAWLQMVKEGLQSILDVLIQNDLPELQGRELVELTYALVRLSQPEATQLSLQLKDQLELLAESHRQQAGAMTDEELQASFSVIGKVSAMIDVIDRLNLTSNTTAENDVLRSAIADGAKMSINITAYLEGQPA